MDEEQFQLLQEKVRRMAKLSKDDHPLYKVLAWRADLGIRRAAGPFRSYDAAERCAIGYAENDYSVSIEVVEED